MGIFYANKIIFFKPNYFYLIFAMWFYTKWIYDLGQRCEDIFYQGDLQKSFRSIAYGIIF
jgi:hypothetical protein